jgi:peptidyl-prolyl cis-trans isomerase SurA
MLNKRMERIMKRFTLVCSLILSLVLLGFSQSDDPVLFTVDELPVHVSEFKYIYTKTNGDKATFSKESLEEYLDLYVRFKMKVKKARDMQLDTIPSLQEELAGYRRQLANSYLVDKEVTEKLVREAYERSQKDIDISHIMFLVKKDASPADTLAAYQKALEAKKRLDAGEDFSKVAKEVSEDKSAKNNGGRLGYLTALLPNGFYTMETAMYSTPKGEISNPVRTALGYHLIKVHGDRPARGELEVAHILIRNDNHKENGAKTLIDSLYQAVQNGADLTELAKLHSEDKRTAKRGGYLGIFGINKYERSFEDGAFALSKDGEISEPFSTSIGWHIVKRISKKELGTYDLARRRLQPKVQADQRYQLAKDVMVDRIKTENAFKENQELLASVADTLSNKFLSPRWKAPKQNEATREVLFSFNDQTRFELWRFLSYCQRSTRARLRQRNEKTATVLKNLYHDYVSEKAIAYEESQLEAKYPEFKALMREYEEGILLFEATKMQVWDRASQDTVGLKAFHEGNADKYQWGERADVTVYTVKATAKDQLEKIRKYSRKSEAEKVLEKFNKDEQVVTVQQELIEKGKNKALDAIEWKEGMLTDTEKLSINNALRFYRVNGVQAPSNKSLKEARGYIIADYQDFLEKAWIKELKSEYPVNVNSDVLAGLIK